jgi:hypothetical protein
MKRQIAYLTVTTALALAPLAFTTGCAVTQHKETAGAYAKDKEIEAKIKTSMYKDHLVKGTQVERLCGFPGSQRSRRANRFFDQGRRTGL